MYRCCASRGDALGALADVREFFGSQERQLVRELQAAQKELRSEKEATHKAVHNLEMCQDEFHESQALYRSERQKLRDTETRNAQERRELRAEEASQAAAKLRTTEQNLHLEARRELAEDRCKAFSAGARKGEEMMLAQYEDALARAVQCGREEGLTDGVRKGEEMMLAQFEGALARAVQCGREEGSAEVHAELAETSQSLRDELRVAEEAQRRLNQKLEEDERVSSRHRREAAHEIAELREELERAKQEDHVRMKAESSESDHMRDADFIVSVEERGTKRNAELTTANSTECRSAAACNSSVTNMYE